MKTVKYILCNYKIYISTIFKVLLLLLFSSFFAKDFSDYKQYLSSLNNSSCRFISYDKYSATEDCYSFYGNDVDVYIDDSENLLNVNVYEFIDGVVYTNNSLLNQNIVEKGTFKILESGEVAISTETANRFNLDIGDKIFIQNKCCEIKYLFSPLYEIFKYDLHTNVQSIFVGSNSISEHCEWYCGFNPTDETHHSYLYNMNVVRDDVKKNLSIKTLIVLLVSILLSALVSSLRIKNESKMILNSVLIGNRKIQCEILVIETLYFIFPSCLLTLLMIWNYYKYLLPVLIVSNFVVLVINILIFFIYNKGVHTYE